MKRIQFFVPGTPIAKQYKQTTGGVIYSKGPVVLWEKTVAQAAMVAAGAGFKKLFGSVTLRLFFRFPIPKSRKELLPGMPHLQDPDLTNLLKAAEDGLKKVLIEDDNLVCNTVLRKVWCKQGEEGMEASVEIDEITN